MLELKIDIIPFGDETKRRNLETIQIINNGTHKNHPEFGNYLIEKIRSETWPKALTDMIFNNHKRDEGFWPLVKTIIDVLVKLKD